MYSIDELTKAHNFAIQRIENGLLNGVYAPLISSWNIVLYKMFNNLGLNGLILLNLLFFSAVVLLNFMPNLLRIKIKRFAGFVFSAFSIFFLEKYWSRMDEVYRWSLLIFSFAYIIVFACQLWKSKNYIYKASSKKGLSKEILKEARNNISTLMDYSTDYYSHDKLVKYNLSDNGKLKGSILLKPDYGISRINRTNQIAIIPKENIDLKVSELNGKKTIKLPLTDAAQQIYLKDDEYSKLSKWKTRE